MEIKAQQQTSFKYNLVIRFPNKDACTTIKARKFAEKTGEIAEKMMGYSFDLDETNVLVCDKSTEISKIVKKAFDALKAIRNQYDHSKWSIELENALQAAKKEFEEAKRIVANDNTETKTIDYVG